MNPRPPAHAEQITTLLRSFKLTTAAEELVPRLVTDGHEPALATIAEVLDLEAEARHARRVARLRRASKLSVGKTFETLDDKRLPRPVVRKLRELQAGDFLDEAINVLAFGLPGVGKSHALAALGHALVEQGRSVLWTPTYSLIQELLAAKRDLELPRKLRRLDNFEFVILDDIGYVKQSAEEAEVLFTLLAERYERRSTALTSNLVFSEWDRIFNNKMATSAAIDRLVHHSVILEFNVSSYRTEKAKGRKKG
ncbi:ATP-binding protein [Pseudenhygromyxa sp. WMMC2535]|uniref:IS21-like element helper ATPase IstB n=1 Tax=Pseudenhygromyxa sp. WMMC2535 TaxID=2712867 RepID=UPI001554CFBD|nr:ATP-binding protein [Pseudenhygromyxa sp. WMMC2535]NVB43506.1 ATP-binding protein [Pseudenhygromyxa sp. WMMC2535]